MTTSIDEPRVDAWPGAEAVRFITRYDAVRAALGDARLTIHKPLTGGDRRPAKPSDERSRRIAPLSSVLSEHLAARAVESLADEVQARTARFIDDVRRESRVDAIEGLASPLPLAIMTRLLGLPEAPAGMLRPVFDRITAGHDFGASEVDRLHGRMALQMLTGWLDRALVGADASSALMTAIRSTAEAHGLDRATVLYWCAMLLYAGSTTTRDFIGNVVAALLARPDTAQTLLREPETLDTAIEELLRVEGPVRGLMREATDDITIGDHAITRGQLVCLMLTDANRDPARFVDPARWNLRRSPNPHLALGANLTYCLGSHLARMETRGVLVTLLPVLGHLRAEPDAPWSTSRLLRGRTRLTLVWHG